MELDKLHSAVILHAHDRIGKSLCSKCLSNSRCSLQDKIFLVFKKRYQRIIIFRSHINLLKEHLSRIWICFDRRNLYISINIVWCKIHLRNKSMFTLCCLYLYPFCRKFARKFVGYDYFHSKICKLPYTGLTCIYKSFIGKVISCPVNIIKNLRCTRRIKCL